MNCSMLMVVTDRISFPLRVFEDTGSLVTWAHRNIIPDRNAMHDILDCALNDILGDEVPGEVVLLRLEVWKYIDGAYGGAEPLVTFNSPVELPGCKAYGGPIHGDNIIHPECDCEDCTRVDFEDGCAPFTQLSEDVSQYVGDDIEVEAFRSRLHRYQMQTNQKYRERFMSDTITTGNL